MGAAIIVTGYLADPRRIELDRPLTRDTTGPIEVILRPEAGPAKHDPIALARALQASSPPQTSDSVDLIREDRDR